MDNFKPTWLYIKQHNVTGLKYFGKTLQDPHTYKGSRVHWTRHINKHGNDVSTVWCQLFTNKEDLTEYALRFSTENNIVESQEWANLIIENGSIGGKTYIRNPKHNKNMSKILSGRTKSEAHKKNLSKALTGSKKAPMSQESKDKKSLAHIGKSKTQEHREKLKAAAVKRWENVRRTKCL